MTKSRGIRKRRHILSGEEQRIAIRLYKQGRSTREIGRHLNTKHDAIGNLLKRRGVDIRSREHYKFSLTPEQESKLVRLRGRGWGYGRLMEKFKIDHWLVLGILRRHGCTKRIKTPKRLSSAETDIAIREYQDGCSGPAVAKRLNIAPATVLTALRRQGVAIRTAEEASRRCSLNQDAFRDAENDPVAAYHVGLLMADGSVCQRGTSGARVQLGLQTKDIASIERFRDFLGSNHKITTSMRTVRLPQGTTVTRWISLYVVTSNRIAADLARYGVVPRKSKTAKVRLLENSIPFWTGAIDGDGSLGFTKNGYPLLQLIGSRAFMVQFLEFVRRIHPHSRNPSRNHTVWSASLSGQAAWKIVSLLYGNCEVAMARKLEIARKIIAWGEGREWRVTKDWSHLRAAEIRRLFRVHGSWPDVAKFLQMNVCTLWQIRKRLGVA